MIFNGLHLVKMVLNHYVICTHDFQNYFIQEKNAVSQACTASDQIGMALHSIGVAQQYHWEILLRLTDVIMLKSFITSFWGLTTCTEV